MPGVLEGIRVLEWTGGHVGPYAAVCLADLGAEVIRIEEVDGGQSGRQTRNFPRRFRRQQLQRGDRSYFFEANNRNKKSIALDLKQPAAREIVYRLVAKSDVFLTNLRRQAAFNLEIDRATLLSYNPRLIYAHTSALGDEGEEAGRAGGGTLIASRLGILMYDRPPHTRPADSLTGGHITDQMGGVSTAYGVVLALLARERLGIVQEVDTSILGGSMWALGYRYHNELSMGTPLLRWRKGSPVPGGRRYKTKDGRWVTVTHVPAAIFSQREWPKLCIVLGLEELIDALVSRIGRLS